MVMLTKAYPLRTVWRSAQPAQQRQYAARQKRHVLCSQTLHSHSHYVRTAGQNDQAQMGSLLSRVSRLGAAEYSYY